MKKIMLAAPAKINLSLDVTGVRADGYHEVEMVMQTVSLYDRIHISVTGRRDEIQLKVNLPYVPRDGRNVAYKAAAAYFEATGRKNPGIFIEMRKHIPVGAGLAGGSANAAAVLLGLDTLLGVGLAPESLQRIGGSVGADVPFCMRGGTALAEGIGERLTELPAMPDCYIVLVKPRRSASTPVVYKAYDAAPAERHPDTEGLVAALSGDVAGLAPYLYNVLEPVTSEIVTEVPRLKAELLEAGALGAMMSGSGPTVFGLFAERASARKAAQILAENNEGFFVGMARPVQHGPVILVPAKRAT